MVIDKIVAEHARHVALRRDIHAHPELAFEERRTADIVAAFLTAQGIEVHRSIAQTGVVGVLSNGGGKCIGLRADMDALPLLERNTFPHHSRLPGKMHACGHDGHTTMLLAAAEYLAAHRDFAGTVVFIFQPAEEGKGGARSMIEEGLFDRFPMDQVFGLHNWPGLPVGAMAIHDGPVMAGSDEFEVVISGHGAHGAMPHQGIDPVIVGSALVQAFQTIVSRNLDPLESAVISVTRFHAGDAYNVIPDKAILGGTARAFRPEVQDILENAMQRICNGIAASFNAQVTLEYRRGYPPTINSHAEAQLCTQVAGQVFGADQVHTRERPTMGAEDFSFFLHERPGCYVWLGNGPGEGGCTLHNPHYDFNDELIPLGASYWVRLVQTVLG